MVGGCRLPCPSGPSLMFKVQDSKIQGRIYSRYQIVIFVSVRNSGTPVRFSGGIVRFSGDKVRYPGS